MLPEQSFQKWYRENGQGITESIATEYGALRGAVYHAIRAGWFAGYHAANHPLLENDPCIDELPLCSFGPDSACR